MGAALPPHHHITLLNTEWWFWPRALLVISGIGGWARWTTEMIREYIVMLLSVLCSSLAAHTLWFLQVTDCAKPETACGQKARQEHGQKVSYRPKTPL